MTQCPFPAGLCSLASLLLAQWLRLPTCLPDGCWLLLLPSLPTQVLPAAFPLPGTGGVHLESLEPALEMGELKGRGWASEPQL